MFAAKILSKSKICKRISLIYQLRYFFTQNIKTNLNHQDNSRDFSGSSTANNEDAKLSSKIVEIIGQKPENKEFILTKRIFERCSPLMQQILKGVKVVDLAEKPKIQNPTVKQAATFKTYDPKHNPYAFRHMLAGQIKTEIALDKFLEKKEGKILLDIKYDGQRTVISYERGGQINMQSRNRKSQLDSFRILKQRLQNQLLKTDIQSIKMDGQIVLVDCQTDHPLPLGELMKMKSIGQNQLKYQQIQLSGKKFLVYIFDVVQFNYQNLMERPLMQRRQFIPKTDILRPTEYKLIQFPEERGKIHQYFAQVLVRNYQGLILKGANDKYYTNQNRRVWKKLKRGFDSNRNPSISKVELDLVVMGANRGSSFKNQHIFNSFLMGAPHQGSIIAVSKVSTGITEDQLAQISQIVQKQGLITDTVPEEYQMKPAKVDVIYKPSIVFQVEAQEFTASPTYNLGRGEYGGLSLRFPTFKRIRSDKGVSEASSGEQILQLSKNFNLNLPE